MKLNTTLAACLLMTALSSTHTINAQFFSYLPEESDYIRGDVKSEVGGLTFTYLLQNDSTLALKTLVLRTDNNGLVLWSKEAGRNFSSYTIAPDTTAIITGVASTSAGNRFALLQKQDKTGAVLWKKTLKSSSADLSIGNIMVGSANTIFATLTRAGFIGSTYYSRSAVIALDMDGQILWTKHFGNSGLTTDYSFTRTILAENGDFIGVADIRGSSGASANGMMVTRISPTGAIRFSKYIDFNDSHNQLSVTGLVETSTQDIIFGGRLMTDQISSYPNTMWLGKLDSLGNLVQQKTYSGGVDVGEQLHSLRYDNGELFAYLHHYSPFDSVTKSVWIGTIDEHSLAFTNDNATELEVSLEDPYGNVSNSFCITSDGKPTIAAGFYCTEKDKYFPLMQQWSPSLVSSCSALERTRPIMDSAASYVASTYTPQGSFTVSDADDTTNIFFTDVVSPMIANLCEGCSTTTGIRKIENELTFQIYPNPGDGHYNIDLGQGIVEAQLTITNILGATVYQTNLQSTHQFIDLSSQSSGVYFMKLHTKDGRVACSKLIKSQ